MSALRPRCAGCGDRTTILRATRWRGHSYCGARCLEPIRDAHLKASHDLADASHTVCRCNGAPRPLEPAGPHCASCRRMFSSGVRAMLADRAAHHRRRRLSQRLRDVLYVEIRLPVPR